MLTAAASFPSSSIPIDGRLKIEKGSLVRIYRELQIEAERNTKT